jgi:next-to-BRCA1 protein 1
MEGSQVFKVKYGNTLRRVTISKTPEPSFADLENRIRDLFQIAQFTPLSVTYVDNEGDVVTMVDDRDFKDAVVLQALNPLRLTVKLVDSASPSLTNSILQSEKSFGRSESSEGLKVEEDEVPAAPAVDSVPVKEEEKPFVPEAASKAAEGTPAADFDLKNIRDEIRNSLKTAWESARQQGAFGGKITEAVPELEALLNNAPDRLAEVVDLAIKSGFSASFETIFAPEKGTENKDGASADSAPAQKGAAADSASGAQPKEQPTPSAAKAAASETPSDTPAAERACHQGIQCDVCGANPIYGPRFKSTVKTDYDLCETCFEKHGVKDEYNRLDRPIFRPRHHPFWAHHAFPYAPQGRMGMRGPCAPVFGPAGPGPCFGNRPFMGRGGGCGRSACDTPRTPEGKLDARFVKDVTIFDGTELPPNTPFTKIWRLRNTGNLPWPAHTRLVHVGGDHFSTDEFVAVAVPDEGLLPEQEIDVSVDQMAPEQPGRYVSHWRLMAPGGRKFGHRVWSLIQVVPKDEPSPQVAESVATGESSGSSSQNLSEETAPSAPPAPTPTPDLIDLSAPAVQALAVPQEAPVPQIAPPVQEPAPAAAPEGSMVEVTSVGGFSLVEHPAPGDASLAVDSEAPAASAVADEMSAEGVVVEASEVSAEDAELASLLNQLEMMGFKDRNLNAGLLREHGLNLPTTLDELVAMADWDPIFAELHEMGFEDDLVNFRLLKKNKGSVKHVVKELVGEMKKV